MVPPENSFFSDADPLDGEALSSDREFAAQVERLHLLTVYGRWCVVFLFWLTLGGISLWHLRFEFALWSEYFTWAAARYAIAFNRWAAVGLSTCIGLTVSVLVWQSRNILWGRSKSEQEQLVNQVLRIRKQGPSHPLWKWINRGS